MTPHEPTNPSAVPWWRKPPLLIAAGAVVLLAAGLLIFSRGSAPTSASAYYEVRRGDFLISIVEGGTIEAVNEVVIRSEVEGTARVIYLVPEGTYVKKGDLLVELDSSEAQNEVNQQLINVEKAQFAYVQAQQQLDIQRSTVESEVDAAKLDVEFAELALKKFAEGERAQLLRNAQMQTNSVSEDLKIAEDRLEWSEELYKQGFETKGNLDRDRLSVTKARMNLEQAVNDLWMLEKFDLPKQRRTLEAALDQANDNLVRVQRQGERRLSQFQADVETQKRTLELSEARLKREQDRLAAAKIKAPQDGLVVYAAGGGRWSNESLIEEGATVRNRQELIKLPDVSSMKLKLNIHESHINNVRRGQAAFVVLDSMPDRRFGGVVSRVAPLPDSRSSFGNPNLKIYPTEVLITEALPDVKPGVSARAEILVTNLPNVLTVPIQAVTTRQGRQVVFLASAPQTPVPVTVGMYNTKFIEVVEGVQEGDRVLLSPPFDTEEKDLGNAVLAEGETPVIQTNQLNLPSLPGREALPAENPRGGAPAQGAEGTGPGGSQRGNRADMLKQFDANGDGELDDTERAAMRERSGSRPRRAGTNAPPAALPPSSTP